MADVAPARQRPPLTPDALSRALLTVARELWVVQDRLIVLEKVLEERGIDVASSISRYMPPPAVEAELKAGRERFANALVDAFMGQELGVDGRPTR